MKTITHVLMSVGGNWLQVAEVDFDERFLEVRFLLNEPVDWKHIATPRDYRQFVEQVKKTLPAPRSEAIDGNFWLMMPGGIDPHVHFDTPGFEFREDFEHASTAAAYGGVTTIIDMPCTSLPPVTSLAHMQTKLAAVKNRSTIDYAFWGGVSGTDFTQPEELSRNIRELAEAGVVGFKTYFISGMEEFTDLTPAQMVQAARWIGSTGLPMAIHAEEKSLVLTRQQQFMVEGRTDWRAYCESRDVLAEALAVTQAVEIARETRTRIHIVHLSSARGVELIRRAQQEGVPISAETCPHYLFFTQEDFDNPEIRNFLKTAPPVKFSTDRLALWQALRNGILSFVTTDHAGCNPEQEKSSPNFWEVYGGIPGVEHRVPFLFSEGLLTDRLNLEQTIRLLSSEVARFFGLNHRKGHIAPGLDADFALVNLWTKFPVKSKEMHSNGKYTPFEDVIFRARVEQTYLRGERIADRENPNLAVQPRRGEFITPQL